MDNSTYSNKKTKDITFGDILEAVKKIEPLPRQKIEVCKKHYKLLEKMITKSKPKCDINGICTMPGNIGSLYGIKIYIRPYLKKIRFYTGKTL